jgi:hypothetical protein
MLKNSGAVHSSGNAGALMPACCMLADPHARVLILIVPSLPGKPDCFHHQFEANFIILVSLQLATIQILFISFSPRITVQIPMLFQAQQEEKKRRTIVSLILNIPSQLLLLRDTASQTFRLKPETKVQ